MKPFLTAAVWLAVIVLALVVLGRDICKHLDSASGHGVVIEKETP